MIQERRFILSLACPDQTGIVAAVSNFFASHGGWITESSNHADRMAGRFFMREEVLASSLPFDLDGFVAEFTPLAERFEMQWRVSDSEQPKRIAIFVSKEEHCLYDLLGRHRSGELPAEIACVIGNHADLEDVVRWHELPFHHVPVTTDKAASFGEVAARLDEAKVDTIVLARYMQIIPPELCAKYAGQIINIHHGFLPSFKGARPYHQAHERGVKLIGATCHYVTPDLDEGPIIEQDVIRIDHGDSIDDLVRAGKDIEKAVLARGLRYHLEDRVLLDGRRTVVFG